MRRRILAAVAAVGIAGASVAVNAAPAPEGGPPPCVGSPQWATYPGDGFSLTCDVQAGQVVHIRYLPSTWTLATAHTYCISEGGDAAHTRYAATANVCTNVDHF